MAALNKFLKRISGNSNMTIKEDAHSLFCYVKVDSLFIVIQSVNWAALGNYRADTAFISSQLISRVEPCVKPFREFTIYYDGTVTSCCDAFYSKDFIQNKLFKVSHEKSIFDLYMSNEMTNLRNNLFLHSPKEGICAKCNSPDLAKKEDNFKRKQIVSQIENS